MLSLLLNIYNGIYDNMECLESVVKYILNRLARFIEFL